MAKMTTQQLQSMKADGIKISMTTAYDYPTARLVDKAGIEIILVGDSLMMTVLGDDSTVACTMEQMIHHIRPVVLGAPNPLIVGDMPFGSYNVSTEQAIANATRLMKEGRCDVIKLEGGREVAHIVAAIVAAGIPVMGHIGLTPQTVSKLGGFKVQGKGEAAARALVDDALALEAAGVWGIVLECIPENVGKAISEQTSRPTIGIGGGRYCDGQVLVFHDMMGIFDRFTPTFVKQYLNLGPDIVEAFEAFKSEVRSGVFPEARHVFGAISESEVD